MAEIEETSHKATSRDLPNNRRKRLFSVLDSIIGFAEEKRVLKGNSDRTKQAWSRLSIQAISSYGALLHDCELGEISERLERLEQKQELEEYR